MVARRETRVVINPKHGWDCYAVVIRGRGNLCGILSEIADQNR